MKRIVIRQPLKPVEDPVAGKPFSLQYSASNSSPNPISDHYDALQIQDEFGRLFDQHSQYYVHARNHPDDPVLKSGSSYDVLFVDIKELPAGTYRLAHARRRRRSQPAGRLRAEDPGP